MSAKGGDEGSPSLKPAPPQTKGAPPGRSLVQAIATAGVLLGAMGVVYLLGQAAFGVLIVAVALVCLWELFDGLVRAGGRPVVSFGLACAGAMVAVAYFERPGLVGAVLVVTMFGGFLLALRPGRGHSAASDVAWTVLGVTWIGGGGAGAASVLVLGTDGLQLLVAFVLIAALDDIGAYFTGTRFGTHRMAPSISPGKSWEGFVGGLVCSLLGGGICAAVLAPLGVVDGIALGALCGTFGPAGDLAESLVKRTLGIKDSGRLLPGHGGFLDRLDAVILCAPVVFLYLRFVAELA
ncbi:MAG: phosphatidate cytidylyltransferase [Actinomycetota bacterium]|nr:phosphatidate cytidylyltransferase [Actinomycetota bacterium]